MKLFSFTLPIQQIKKMKEHSKKTGLSIAEILRRAIDKYFELLETK